MRCAVPQTWRRCCSARAIKTSRRLCRRISSGSLKGIIACLTFPKVPHAVLINVFRPLRRDRNDLTHDIRCSGAVAGTIRSISISATRNGTSLRSIRAVGE